MTSLNGGEDHQIVARKLKWIHWVVAEFSECRLLNVSQGKEHKYLLEFLSWYYGKFGQCENQAFKTGEQHDAKSDAM